MLSCLFPLPRVILTSKNKRQNLTSKNIADFLTSKIFADILTSKIAYGIVAGKVTGGVFIGMNAFYQHEREEGQWLRWPRPGCRRGGSW
jgi:hypothetical protein